MAAHGPSCGHLTELADAYAARRSAGSAPKAPPAARQPSTYALGVRTFPEIAEELGTSVQNVQQIYQKAMRKLRSRPHSLDKLLDIAEMLQTERNRRESCLDDGHRVAAQSKKTRLLDTSTIRLL